MTGTVRRALVLAGGGLKVAYQAGVLQVWLDEAGVDMQLATGSSGGTLNLAMWSQGFTGRQIAEAWRGYRPLAAASVHPEILLRGPFAPAMLSGKGLRRNIFPAFGLDWHAIRNSKREAVFDVYNFTAHEHRAVGPADLTEDLLVSAVSLPWWFDPVRVGSDTYIDAVFATDSNLEEAIRRGATELWVVWTVSTRGIWRKGFVNGYFQMIEAMANAELRAGLRRIEESNAAIDDDRPGYYPHRVKVRVLAAEVPMHYLVVLRRSQVRRAVELGVADARRWCRERGIPLAAGGFSCNGHGNGHGNGTAAAVGNGDRTTDRARRAAAGISFRERMAGTLRLAGPEQPATPCELRLEVTITDVERFVADPEHRGRVHGTVVCPALGGTLPIRSGCVNLLVEKAIGDLRMIYELTVPDADGRVLFLRGEKFVHHDTGLDLWRDTTTLHTTVHDEDRRELAAGILRLSPAGLLRQLASMRQDRPGALLRFMAFFLGRLTDTYLKPHQPRSTPAWLRAVSRK